MFKDTLYLDLVTTIITSLLFFQTIQDNGINVTARQMYKGPYFHEETESATFAKIVADTYQSTRGRSFSNSLLVLFACLWPSIKVNSLIALIMDLAESLKEL